MPRSARQRRKQGKETVQKYFAETSKNASGSGNSNLWLKVVTLCILACVGVGFGLHLVSNSHQSAVEMHENGESDSTDAEMSSSKIVADSDVSTDVYDSQQAVESEDLEAQVNWDWEVKKPSGARLSPEWIEQLISSLGVDEGREEERLRVEPIDRDSIIREARRNVMEKQWMEAKRLYRHILQYNASDKQALNELHYIYHKQYPEGPDGTTTFNFTKHLFATIKKRLKQKKFTLDDRSVTIERLDPNIYVFHDFLSDEECDHLIRLHQESLQNASLPPLMCFQHDHFMANEVIKSNVIEGTYCLRQSWSLQVAPYLTWSYSTSHYRGEDLVVDRIERRIEEVGLGHRHARDMQMLLYDKGVSYNDHSDCFYRNTVMDHDKTATFLGYLQDDDLEGGETVFPRLGISIKPKRGMAVIFYNFNGKACNLDMMHRSAVVTKGKKLIAQKWYSYPDAPFYNERPFPIAVNSRLPYQPVVSCDYILAGGESSCRWYEHWPFPPSTGTS